MTANPGRRGIGLRGRLVAFFLVITVLPVTAAVVALQYQIDRQLEQRTGREVATVSRASVALVGARLERAADLADDLGAAAADAVGEGLLLTPLADSPDALGEWFDEAVGEAVPGRADLAGLVTADGEVLGLVAREPLLEDPVEPEAVVIEAVEEPAAVEAALVELRELRVAQDGGEEQIGFLVAGVWADAELLEQLGAEGGAAFVGEERVLAVTGAPADAVPLGALPARGRIGTVEIAGEEAAVSVAPLVVDGPAARAVWSPRAERGATLAIGAAVLIPSVVLAILLGWLLATAVIAPVRRAADAARDIAAGDLSRSLEPTGGPELADLAAALNTMRAELVRRLEELARSRDQLRGSLDRLGVTLSSSLDLNRTLAVVVETAKDTLEADRALLLLYTPERDALYCKVARGLPAPPALDVRAGLVGFVARGAVPVLVPSERDGDLPAPVGGEPTGTSQVAVPLLGRGRVLGTMTLLRDDPDRPFTRGDLDTIRSFAAQASVAIENVLLHQEARRLSVTDSLTGLWNFRYFQLQAEREVESAQRFERPLALVIVDIDHFKEVNDDHGHQVGDVVLAEVARRIRGATRAPDVAARYGGEEFVVLLPGTDLRGAGATAERIRRAVADDPVDVRGVPVPSSAHGVRAGPDELAVTCSAGVSSFPDHGRTVAGLLRSADAAMYTAKRRGRDRVVGAHDLDDEGARGVFGS